MKYFIYTRKSTESEDRQVMSLESQLSELKKFAAKEKFACPFETESELIFIRNFILL